MSEPEGVPRVGGLGYLNNMWAPALLLAVLLMVAALAACAGKLDSSEPASVSAGGDHICGVRDDGTVACWGNDYAGQTTPPKGRFASVSAGYDYACGVRDDDTVACWCGAANLYGAATPPEGRFSSVSAGRVHACGLRDDGTFTCWCGNHNGQALPPRERFSLPK